MGCLPFPSDYKRKRRFLTLIKHDDSDAHEKADFSEARVDEPEITPHTQDSGFQESESVCDVSVVSLSSSSDEDEKEAVGDKLTCSLCDQVFGSAELLSQHGIVHEANNTTSPFVSNIEDSIYDKILAEEADRDASEVTEPSSGLSDSLLEDYDSLVDSLISSVSPDELLQKISITDEFPDNYADDRREEEQREEAKSASNCDLSQTSSSSNDRSMLQIIPISKKAKIIPRSKTKKSSVISAPSAEDLSLKSQLELSSDNEADPSSHGSSKVTIPIRKKEKRISKINRSKRRRSNWSSTPSIKDLASNRFPISEDEEESDNASKKPKLDEISKEDIEFENMVNQKVFKILSQKNATYSKDKSIFIGAEKTHIQLRLPESPSVRHCDSQPEEETNLLHAGHLKVRQPCRRREQKRFLNTQQRIDDVYSGIREEAAACDKTRRRLDRTTARWKRGSLKHQLGLELKSIPYTRRSYGSGLLEACGLEEEGEAEEDEADNIDQSKQEELNGGEQRAKSTEPIIENNRLSNPTPTPSHSMNKPDASNDVDDPDKIEDVEVDSCPPSNTSIAESLETHETTDDENTDNEGDSNVKDKVATEISHDLSMPVFEF